MSLTQICSPVVRLNRTEYLCLKIFLNHDLTFKTIRDAVKHYARQSMRYVHGKEYSTFLDLGEWNIDDEIGEIMSQVNTESFLRLKFHQLDLVYSLELTPDGLRKAEEAIYTLGFYRVHPAGRGQAFVPSHFKRWVD